VVEQNKRSSTEADYVSNDALRSMCENVLQLLSTTVDNMDVVSCHCSPFHYCEVNTLYGIYVMLICRNVDEKKHILIECRVCVVHGYMSIYTSEFFSG